MENVTNNNENNFNGKRGNARYIAVRLLSRFERSDSYVDKLLSHELSHNEMSSQDKGLLTEIVNGVIRHRGKLDWALTGFYFGDYQKCLNIVKNAMRVGLYQIMFLNRVPIHSAIDESVEIVKNIQGDKTAGIVNAVLRNITRNMDKIRYPDRDADPVYYLSVIYSHPKWMAKRWIERYGEIEAEKLLTANNQRPSVIIRVNNLRSAPETIAEIFEKYNLGYNISPYLPQSIIMPSPKYDISASELFRKGEITIQDTSASMAAKLTSPKEGDTVIDLCAAPGGKSFFIAELMNDKGKVIAVDKYSSKLRFIEEGALRLGLTSIELMTEDARNLRLKEPVDIVLTDVPCSGLGTISKKPDIKWKREQEDIAKIVELQREIMTNAAKMVKSGGVFVYSTCTIEPEENEENIKWFLNEYPEFELDPAENYLPEEVCKNGFMQTFPHIHNTDGAFAARLIKKG